MKFLIYGVTKGRGDGIGRTVALQLQDRGHEIWGLCRDTGKAAATTDIKVEAIDIGTDCGIDRLKEILREFNPDVIWSACGTGSSSPVWVTPMQEIENMIDANIRNILIFCKACAPSCIDGGPHLVLTGSVAAIIAEGAAVYSGTKGFLLPFVRSMRTEFLRQGRKARISTLVLPRMRDLGADAITSTLEFLAMQPRGVDVLWG